LVLAVIRGEASRVPEANLRLHAELVNEREQRPGGVQGLVTPCGAGKATLEDPPMISNMAKQPFATFAVGCSLTASSTTSLSPCSFAEAS
jgi:hypothetical protein